MAQRRRQQMEFRVVNPLNKQRMQIASTRAACVARILSRFDRGESSDEPCQRAAKILRDENSVEKLGWKLADKQKFKIEQSNTNR